MGDRRATRLSSRELMVKSALGAFGVGKCAIGWSSGSAASVRHAQSVGIDDGQATTGTIDDARISVRMVAPDGDVLWTTTQESTDAKYKGATADAAYKLAKVLMREVGRIGGPDPSK